MPKKTLSIGRLSELVQELKTFPAKVETDILPKVLRSMAKPVVNQTRKNITPIKRSGFLRKSVASIIKKYKSGVSVAVIGIGSRIEGTFNGKRVVPINYAHLVEGGTAPHKQPKRGPFGVMHPGARAQPFLSPAYRQAEGQVKSIAEDEILKEIEKQSKLRKTK